VVAPASVPGFTGPTQLGGAINAPLDSNGRNTFMGSKFYPFSQSQSLNMESCTTACNAQTAYNKAHPKSDGTYQTCVSCICILNGALLLIVVGLCEWICSVQEWCAAGSVLFDVHPDLGPVLLYQLCTHHSYLQGILRLTLLSSGSISWLRQIFCEL